MDTHQQALEELIRKIVREEIEKWVKALEGLEEQEEEKRQGTITGADAQE